MGSASIFGRLPLHIIASILSQLDKIADVSLVIQTNRIFLEAFKDNRASIARCIVTNQLPEDTLPYAAALAESRQVNPSNHDAVREVLARLETRLEGWEAGKRLSLPQYTFSEYAALSHDLFAIETFKADMVAEALPAFKEMFRADHPPEASSEELFRINRAFLRYQIMCNLFCIPVKVGKPLWDDEISRYFFTTHPAWVNEQMLCVYAYLERKVAEAFDDVAAHDVEWGEMPINWSDDGTDCHQIQWHLSRGLPFLLSLYRARTFDERHQLMPIYPTEKMRDHYGPFQRLRLMYAETGEEWLGRTASNEKRLSDTRRPSGGKSMSTPFGMWCSAHHDGYTGVSVHPVVDLFSDRNAWECAYVMWDLDMEIAELPRGFDAVSVRESFFPRAHNAWTSCDVVRSEKQRSYIYLAGGEGYWPFPAKDFSRVTGLSEDVKQELLAKFQDEEARGVHHTWYA